MYSQINNEGYTYQLMDEIIDHQKDAMALLKHFALSQQSIEPCPWIVVKTTMEATVALILPWPPSLWQLFMPMG
jgi:hypothetical protein